MLKVIAVVVLACAGLGSVCAAERTVTCRELENRWFIVTINEDGDTYTYTARFVWARTGDKVSRMQIEGTDYFKITTWDPDHGRNIAYFFAVSAADMSGQMVPNKSGTSFMFIPRR